MTKPINDEVQVPQEPEVLLLTSSHCVHCTAVMQVVTAMVKQGDIAALKIINLEKRPELAQQLGVRSVPWLKIGEFVFEGELSAIEIKHWIDEAGAQQGEKVYLSGMLIEGKVDKVIDYIKQTPDALQTVAEFMLDADAKINLKLGVGVIFEEFAMDSLIDGVIEQLLEYINHEDARVRGDACHYLSLTGRKAFIPVFENCLLDNDADVRAIAQESLDDLSEN